MVKLTLLLVWLLSFFHYSEAIAQYRLNAPFMLTATTFNSLVPSPKIYGAIFPQKIEDRAKYLKDTQSLQAFFENIDLIYKNDRGGDMGNGGNELAIEFATSANKLLTAIKRDVVLYPKINVQDFERAIQETKVFAVNFNLCLMRDVACDEKTSFVAKNYQLSNGLKVILVNVDKWNTISFKQKNGIVIHEYLGITNNEQGTYQNSSQFFVDSLDNQIYKNGLMSISNSALTDLAIRSWVDLKNLLLASGNREIKRIEVANSQISGSSSSVSGGFSLALGAANSGHSQGHVNGEYSERVIVDGEYYVLKPSMSREDHAKVMEMAKIVDQASKKSDTLVPDYTFQVMARLLSLPAPISPDQIEEIEDRVEKLRLIIGELKIRNLEGLSATKLAKLEEVYKWAITTSYAQTTYDYLSRFQLKTDIKVGTGGPFWSSCSKADKASVVAFAYDTNKGNTAMLLNDNEARDITNGEKVYLFNRATGKYYCTHGTMRFEINHYNEKLFDSVQGKDITVY